MFSIVTVGVVGIIGGDRASNGNHWEYGARLGSWGRTED